MANPVMADPMAVCDGKYTFFTSENGLLDCLRHGEPWPAFRERGDHLAGSTLAIYRALVEERRKTAELTERLRDTECEWGRTIGRLDSAARSAENAASVIRGAHERALADRGPDPLRGSV